MAARPPAQPQPEPQPVSLFRLPHFELDYTGCFPDRVKVKKTIKFWPLEATGALVWEDRSLCFSHRFTVKDQFLKGKFRFDSGRHEIQYRKRFHLPTLGGGLFMLVGAASWDTRQLQPKPRLHIGLEIAKQTGRGAMLQPTCIALRRKFFLDNFLLTRHLGLETRGKFTVQLPTTFGFSLGGPPAEERYEEDADSELIVGAGRDGPGGRPASLRRRHAALHPAIDGFSTRLRLEELNLVVRL